MIARVTPTLVICALGAAVTGALLALPAAGEEESTVPPASLPAGAATVQIADFSFGPARAAAGTTISVVNADGVAHTLTADDGSFGTGVVDSGATAAFVAPAAPGTYEILCEIHPTMTGALVVD